MRTLLAALILVFVLAGCSRDHALSKAAYTEDFAGHLRKAAPQHKVEVIRELELKVTTPNGHDTTAYLDNGYAEYHADPTKRDEIYAKFAAGLLDAAAEIAKDTPLDPATIIPIIKDHAWPTEIATSSRVKKNADKPIELVFESFNAELVVVYAEDTPKNVSYLTPTRLATTAVKREELRKLAVENLKRLLPQVEARGAKGVYFATAGGTYEACLLLLDDIWREKKFEVDGDYVVAVPARDILLITGSKNAEGIEKIRKLAKETVAGGSYTLTADLFVYRDGKFTKFVE